MKFEDLLQWWRYSNKFQALLLSNIIIHWLLLSIQLISSSLFYVNFLPPTTTHNTLSAILRCYDPIMHKSQGIKANMINVAEYLLWMGWHPYIKDSVMMHFFYISAWRFMPLNSVSDCSCLMYRNHTIRIKLHTRLKKLQRIHICVWNNYQQLFKYEKIVLHLIISFLNMKLRILF